MRKIKFRGRRAQNDWYYGCLDLLGDEPKIGFRDSFTDDDSGEVISFVRWVAVDPDTIGQFTGYVDMNGKEIYEDDVVQFKDGKIAPVRYESNLCGFFAACQRLDPWAMEVIGNIHDDPRYNK